MDLLSSGNSAFVDEDYPLALSLYTKARPSQQQKSDLADPGLGLGPPRGDQQTRAGHCSPARQRRSLCSTQRCAPEARAALGGSGGRDRGPAAQAQLCQGPGAPGVSCRCRSLHTSELQLDFMRVSHTGRRSFTWRSTRPPRLPSRPLQPPSPAPPASSAGCASATTSCRVRSEPVCAAVPVPQVAAHARSLWCS